MLAPVTTKLAPGSISAWTCSIKATATKAFLWM